MKSEDLRVECSKFGQIRKLLLFDRHPDGVASVSFRDPEEADYCIQTLNGRWFGGRQITAQAWDGTTDYQVEETTREREERLRGWEAFLNAPEANRGLQRSNSIRAQKGQGLLELGIFLSTLAHLKQMFKQPQLKWHLKNL